MLPFGTLWKDLLLAVKMGQALHVLVSAIGHWCSHSCPQTQACHEHHANLEADLDRCASVQEASKSTKVSDVVYLKAWLAADSGAGQNVDLCQRQVLTGISSTEHMSV